MATPQDNFIKSLEDSLEQKSFVKLNLGNYKGSEVALSKVLIKKVIIKKKENLSFVYRYQTKDITKNYLIQDAIHIIKSLIDKAEFNYAKLFTLISDIELLTTKSNDWKIRKAKASSTALLDTNHDKNKIRKIEPLNKQYLYELKITDNNGKIRTHGQDKYKQINHYIEILSSLLKELPKREITNIVDMGSGKGYLTFGLYDYLNNVLQLASKVTGVEYRKDLVDLCNSIAKKSNFERLSFKEGTIQDYTDEVINVLIALHACDTATDDAIYKGIQSKADLIVVAPCCHKQIRKEMQKGKVDNEISTLTKHGIFMERQAEMVTDTLRALYLEYAGYKTKVFEFIATQHTPKNVLIVAQKRTKAINKSDILKDIQNTKKHFGIEKHYLETLLDLSES